MSITASTGQQAAMPVRSTADTANATALLINGASFSSTYVATADKIVGQVSPSGALSGDCTLQLQISPNGSNFGILRTFTNAEISTVDGTGFVAEVGIGTSFRFRFVAGTTTGAGNGVTARFRN